MDSKTPYLDAIQKIPGNTVKEKHESLSRIVKQVIESKKAPDDSSLQTIYGSPIPQILTPLIEIEVAKRLRNIDHVIIALKSDDFVIVNRALQAKWIFDGSNKLVTNYPYFATHILPEVSANTRTKIIKRLAKHLRSKNEHTVAQDFFEGLSNTFGLKKAMPLLMACSEDYIWEFINNEDSPQPEKKLIRLFSMYPKLVIKYLKSRSIGGDLSFGSYWNLRRRLLKNHMKDFVDLVNTFSVKTLNTKRAEMFLKIQGKELLITNPEQYLHMFPLKLITQKLTKDEFEQMLRNLCPKDQTWFRFDDMLSYVQFQPQELKLPLITKIFRDSYGVDLITLLDKVSVKMMLMLPEEDRVNVAQKKLALDPEFNLDNCEDSWVCYLSTADSVPRIKEQIAKKQKMEDRAALVKHLIYTCKVNKSEKDLLLVLEYISSRHRNELPEFWFRVYQSLMKYFDLASLSSDHWQVLNKMIQRSYVKDYLTQRTEIAQMLLEKVIHYNLLNNIPIEEQMTILTELKIKEGVNCSFSILSHYPKFEKQCLEIFVDIISRKFPEGNNIWEGKRLNIIQNLVDGLYEYNLNLKIACKKGENLKSEELLSVRKYPWLLDIVKYIVYNDGKEVYLNKIIAMKSLIRNLEPELYDSLFPPKKVKFFEQFKPINLLKKEPGTILENWKACLESCEENIKTFQTKRFLRNCLWYNEIPGKFVEESLRKLDEGDSRSLMILALLLRGPEFVRVIEPMVSVSKMEIDQGTKKSFGAVNSVSRAITLVNPPPSLEWVGNFFEGDWFVVGFNCLMNVAKRVSFNKVIAFSKSLNDKPIRVKKQGIRLMYFLTSTADLCEYFRYLWTTEEDKSIRKVIFQKAFNLFTDRSCKDTWLLMELCIGSLTGEEIEWITNLKDIKKIPKEYSTNYFDTTLSQLEKLTKEGLKSEEANKFITTFLSDTKINKDLPEEYCRALVRKFAFDFNIDRKLLKVGQRYSVDSFLFEANAKLESRLEFFCDLLTIAISNHWEDTHPENCRFYPMKNWFHNMVRDILRKENYNDFEPKISRALIKLFPSPLQPIQAPHSFLSLFFFTEFRNAKRDVSKFGLSVGQKIPSLIEFFSVEMIFNIAYKLLDFMDLAGINYKATHLIESLLKTNVTHSATVATIILMKQYTKIPDKAYKNIVEKLRKLNRPDIVTILNLHTISVDLNDIYDNKDNPDNSDNESNSDNDIST